MKLSIVDTHSHLDIALFSKDGADVIAMVLDSGLRTMLWLLQPGGFCSHRVTGIRQVDIANAVLFLSSEVSRNIIGESVNINAGLPIS